MYSITIKGFRTKEAVNAFWLWYQEQGEQDIIPFWDVIQDSSLCESSKIGDSPLSSCEIGWDDKNKICQIKN